MLLQGTVTSRLFKENTFGKRSYWLLLDVKTKNKIDKVSTTSDIIPTVGDYILCHGSYINTKYGSQFKSPKCTFMDPVDPLYILERFEDFSLSPEGRKFISGSKIRKLVKSRSKDIWLMIENQKFEFPKKTETDPDEIVPQTILDELKVEYLAFKKPTVAGILDITQIINYFEQYELVINEKCAKTIFIGLGTNAIQHIKNDIVNLCGLLDLELILELCKARKIEKDIKNEVKYLANMFETCRDNRYLCLPKESPEDDEDDSDKEIIDKLVEKKRIIFYNNYMYPVPSEYGHMQVDDDEDDDEQDAVSFSFLPKRGYIDLDYNAAKCVSEMIIQQEETPLKPPKKSVIARIVEEENLCKEQEEALTIFSQTLISVVTGQPGTGKTKVIRSFIKLCKVLSWSFHIMSPTGCATRRIRVTIKDITNDEASTVHSFLYGKENIPYQVLIIDEASMMDALLLHDLLMSKLYQQIVFIGDCDQLCPPGIGYPFKELLVADRLPVTKLTQNFRFGEETEGMQKALKMILKGNDKIYDCGNGLEIAKDKKKIISFCKKLEKYDPDIVRILTPTNKEVNDMNLILRSIFNPDAGEEKIIDIGDSVIQMKNTMIDNIQMKNTMIDNIQMKNTMIDNIQMKNTMIDDIQLYNGDIMTITDIKTVNEKKSVKIDGKMSNSSFKGKVYVADLYGQEVRLKKVKNLKLAYVSTTHKAQGSECKTSIIYLPYDTRINTRNLLYTAVSRAKTKCIIVADPEVLSKCIKRKDPIRYSNLCEMINEKVAVLDEEESSIDSDSVDEEMAEEKDGQSMEKDETNTRADGSLEIRLITE